MRRLTPLCLLSLALSCSSSGGGGSPDGGVSPDGGPGPTCTDCTPTGAMTFALPSPKGATLWTTTTMDKVLRVGYVKIASPSDPAAIPSGEIPDPLYPTTFGATEHLPGGQNQPYWLTVRIPKAAVAGDYTATLTVTVGGVAQAVPVKLHVYDFAIPDTISFDGNWNSSFQALGGGASLDAVKSLKDFFFQHRLVPSGVAWPAGLNYTGGITYDCPSDRFTEKATDPYEFANLGPAYIDGKGWNGIGFPSFEVMQFVDNSTPRPQTFCGVDRGPDAFGTAAYNAKWSKLLAAVDAYLVAHAWTDKGYYYVQNEPQNQADYDVAAFLAHLTKTAAPHLRIAVSEQPRKEIVENARAQGSSYDLWWADLSEFDPSYAKVRQAAGESVWWYFLYGDLPPHFNPITIDHPGIESRIAHWAAFKYRIKGFAYYSVTGWGADPVANPKPEGTNQNGDGFLLYPPAVSGGAGQLVTSIRWELLREGEEDFEYLKLAAGGTIPATPDTATTCEASVASVVSSTTSFTHDASALKHLRDQLGLMLEGKVNGCPVLDSKPVGAHPSGAYYVNFQDPAGEPKAALAVDGHTWQKIGWSAYDAKLGFGWSGPYIGDATIMKYQYLADAPVNELQKSIIYDDYGRTDTFNWDIANGKYVVTVSIGWYGKTYSKNRVIVEGQPLFADVETNAATPYQVKSVTLDVADGNVTLEVGQKDEYTMLNWLSIEPAK
jgi:hypothetical protein